MGIIDIILIVIALLAFAMGLYKGLAGVLLGFVGTLLIAAVLAVAVPFALPSVIYKDKDVKVVAEDETLGYSDMFYQVYSSAVAPRFTDSGNDLFDTVYVANGDELGVEMETEDGIKVVSLSDYVLQGFADSPVGQFLPLAGGLINKLTAYGAEGLTVGQSFAGLITYMIFDLILWTIGFTLLFIVKLIIRHFVFKALDSHSIVSKIDRVLGALVLVSMIVVVVWGAFSFLDVNKTNWNIADALDSVTQSNSSLRMMSQNNLMTMLGLGSQSSTSDGSANTPEVTDCVQALMPITRLY